jgi:hypothetical protein
MTAEFLVMALAVSVTVLQHEPAAFNEPDVSVSYGLGWAADGRIKRTDETVKESKAIPVTGRGGL